MKEVKFYICNHCGNIITKIHDAGVPVVCCGEKMHELVPGSVDAAVEKHLPVVKVEGDTLTATVGSVEHPMSEEHWIDWIYVLTEKGGQMKKLVPGEKPELTFALGGEKPVAVYAYCNLHGLWRTEV